MKNLKKAIVLIALLFILILVLLITLNKNTSKTKDTSILEEQVNIELLEVTNHHMYFSVRSCVDQYLYYIQQKDWDSVIKILDKGYVKKFNINNENITQYIENIETSTAFDIDEIKYAKLDEAREIYFIKGTATEETMSVETTEDMIQKVTVTVKVDMDNMTFSVIPFGYGGPMYEEKN